MKKELIIGIILLAVMIAGMFVVLEQDRSETISDVGNTTTVNSTIEPTSESGNVAGRVSHNLVLNSLVKESVDSIMVYKTLSPVVTDEITLEYAEIFNVTGILKDSAVVQSEDLRFAVEISKKSGRVIYSDFKRPNVKQDAPQYLPSDEEAIEIATKFLKEKGLYPDGVADIVVQRDNTYSSKDTITFSEIGVWFRRNLNYMKVEGTQLVVYVGGGGDIIGYYVNWRDYEPYEEYPIISAEEAFENLKSEGVYVGMNSQDTLVSIDDSYLAYLTTAGAYTEEYLQPVWVFRGNVMADGKAVMPVEEYIPALEEVPEELIAS